MPTDRRAARPGKAPALRESDVQRQVVEAAACFGVVLDRRNTGAFPGASGRMVRCGTKGDSDLTGTLPDGRRIDVEVKRPGKKPTTEQWDRIHKINASNGVAFYVTDPEQITRVMPLLLRGCWVETEANGKQFVTDEPIRSNPC